MSGSDQKLAVVIPCFRAGERVLEVLSGLGSEVGWIFLVDDACPLGTGRLVERSCRDPRVKVLYHKENQGVGGATVTGYKQALAMGADIVVKLDADGQMDPALITALVTPIRRGRADYVKGNRFHRVRDVASMPRLRLFGNAVLSFLTKLSSGYWQVFDPTNGLTAVHRATLVQIDLDKVAKRYFFESDLLFHLNMARAVVAEMPMKAVYGDEPSSLRPSAVVWPFLFGHLRNMARRIAYSYFLRGFSVASLELLLGPPLLLAGGITGVVKWHASIVSGVPATAGSVMLAALPVLLGVQLLLSWLHFDIASEPKVPVQAASTGSGNE
ncbi:MAG: glycosyltransferase family 2 protein [Wenzhouxiangella sp.]|nr:glycosyltransferase family 2 protein [Wenzhouxiangella sp.]